jgi:hypothetical protein
LFEELQDHREDPEPCTGGKENEAFEPLRRLYERVLDSDGASDRVSDDHVVTLHFKFDELRDECGEWGHAVERRTLTGQAARRIDGDSRYASQLGEESIVGVVIVG